MLTRRSLLAALAALPLTTGARSKASLPTIDSVELTVVADGTVVGGFGTAFATDGFAVKPPSRLASYRDTFKAEWGYSVLARAQVGGADRRVLVDFGYSPEIFANNARLLGIDTATIDAMVLSHGHRDHYGGLEALVASRSIRHGTPIYVGGEEIFCERLRGTVPDAPAFGRIDRAAVERAGANWLVSNEPQPLAGIGFTTGAIPFVSPERPKVPTMMVPGQGCALERLPEDRRLPEPRVDDAQHELGTAFAIRGRGLVVIGSCSHRGIINTVRQAQAVSGEQRIFAIVGGFHLVAPQTEAQALETVDLMKALDPAWVVPGHCSGESFIAAATAAMPGRVHRAPVGTKLVFGKI
ncbi:MAG: MBL fold metallo-hydrolase [Sphingopyxis sp.]|nr:MBL fold metallo-hydrolase [Sphingopyxis sp.]